MTTFRDELKRRQGVRHNYTKDHVRVLTLGVPLNGDPEVDEIAWLALRDECFALARTRWDTRGHVRIMPHGWWKHDAGEPRAWYGVGVRDVDAERRQLTEMERDWTAEEREHLRHFAIHV